MAITTTTIILTVVVSLSSLATASSYCVPYNTTGGHTTCWPTPDKWDALSKKLTGPLKRLYYSSYRNCYNHGDNAYGIRKEGHGICMQYHDCSKAFCQADQRWNIPEYSVEARDVTDIQAALKFATDHNIAVTVKTSGHNYAGSSMGYGTLLIWMYNYKKYGTISSFKDSCGKTTAHALKVGGGQVWKEAYDAVGDQYHIVGGGGLTVSAAGGWLMGCGLSALSRNLGIGIDNVLRFEVVLADGRLVIADGCSNDDLFWALRGGGGGTFGVVTAVYYKLHPVTPVVFSYMNINDILTWPWPTKLTYSWIDFWVDKSLTLDKRWGGYWSLNSHILYFQGSEADAEATFLKDFKAWLAGFSKTEREKITFTTSFSKSYYTSRGGRHMTTDKTGAMKFNIASRLIPRDFVQNNPKKMKEILKWMVHNGFHTFNYILGGVMEQVGTAATAVNPAMRKAIWQIETFDERLIGKLRKDIKNTGAGYNHASKQEPDWENSFWGTNLKRLQDLKKKFDPNNRFNCWHCVGYKKMQLAPENLPSSSVQMKLSLTLIAICFSMYHVFV